MIQDLSQRLLISLVTLTAFTRPIAAVATTVQTLPVINGIRPGRVTYVQSETLPRPKIERAILKALSTVYPQALSQDLPPRDRLRYYYNRINLNGDRQLETIAYVVGEGTCSREGCLALIFTQSPQGLQLVSQFSAVHAPILVLGRKTAGWRDLVFFVSSASDNHTPPRYALVQFNGQTYPDHPARQPVIPANTHLRGTAILAGPIHLTNGLPLRSLAELSSPVTTPDSPRRAEDEDQVPLPSLGHPPPTSQSAR
ncbi:hypothetical protein [Trichothermofontia sp.]